jgi:hypothetical protein
LSARLEALERAVAVVRLVMEQDDAPGSHGPRECDCIGDARVTPADAGLVLVLEVLGVVEEHVDVARDRGAGEPVARSISDWAAKRRFVIRDVGEACRGGFDAEAHRGPRMDDKVGSHRRAIDRPRLPRDVVERHPSWDVAELDRKERRGKGARDPFSKALDRRRRSPDIHGDALVPERGEKAKTLDVVEVQVRQEEIDMPRAAVDQVVAESPDTGSSVENEGGSVVERDFDAGRVPAVADGLSSGAWHRATATPDPHAHTDPTLLSPEDCDDPDELVGMSEEGKGRHGDFTIHAVPARDQKSLV